MPTGFDVCQDCLNYPSPLRRRDFTNKIGCDSEVVETQRSLKPGQKITRVEGNQAAISYPVGTPFSSS